MRRAPQGLPAAHADLHLGLREVVGVKGESDLPDFAGAQVDPLEATKTP